MAFNIVQSASTPYPVNNDDWAKMVAQIKALIKAEGSMDLGYSPFLTAYTYANSLLSVTVAKGMLVSYFGALYLNDADMLLTVSCSAGVDNKFVLLFTGDAGASVITPSIVSLDNTLGNGAVRRYNFDFSSLLVKIDDVDFMMSVYGILFNSTNSVFKSIKYMFNSQSTTHSTTIEIYGDGSVYLPSDSLIKGNIKVNGSVTINRDIESLGAISSGTINVGGNMKVGGRVLPDVLRNQTELYAQDVAISTTEYLQIAESSDSILFATVMMYVDANSGATLAESANGVVYTELYSLATSNGVQRKTVMVAVQAGMRLYLKMKGTYTYIYSEL